MYKFISYAEYIATHEERVETYDDNGVMTIVPTQVRTSPYAKSHPKARVCPDKLEVVLSCSDHDQPCSCLTHAEAVKRIADNWSKDNIQNYTNN